MYVFLLILFVVFPSSNSLWFSVTSGDCEVLNYDTYECVTSPNYPSGYSTHDSGCNIEILASFTLNVVEFDLDAYSYVDVNCDMYNGNTAGPVGVSVSSNANDPFGCYTVMQFNPFFENGNGFEICSNGQPPVTTDDSNDDDDFMWDDDDDDFMWDDDDDDDDDGGGISSNDETFLGSVAGIGGLLFIILSCIFCQQLRSKRGEAAAVSPCSECIGKCGILSCHCCQCCIGIFNLILSFAALVLYCVALAGCSMDPSAVKNCAWGYYGVKAFDIKLEIHYGTLYAVEFADGKKNGDVKYSTDKDCSICEECEVAGGIATAFTAVAFTCIFPIIALSYIRMKSRGTEDKPANKICALLLTFLSTLLAIVAMVSFSKCMGQIDNSSYDVGFFAICADAIICFVLFLTHLLTAVNQDGKSTTTLLSQSDDEKDKEVENPYFLASD